MQMPRIKNSPNSTVLLGRFVMVSATLVMAAFLIVGGLLMGAGGRGVFGEPVPMVRQVAGILTILCGAALVPLGIMMARRAAKRYVMLALGVVIVELLVYMVGQHTVPLFGVVYAAVLAIGFKLSR